MDPLTEVLFDEEKKRMQFPVSFAIVCVTAGFVVYFYSQEDYGTATATAVLGVALRSGYRAGASTYLGFLAGVVLAMFAAAPVGKLLAPVFQQVFGTHGVTNRLLSVGTVGSIMILMLTLWVRNHIRRQFRNRPWLKNYDKLLGLALGGVQGCVIFLVMAGGAIIVEPFARNALSTRRSDGGAIQRFAQRVVVVAETTRSGTIGPYVAAWNPFEHIGVLKSLMQGMAVLQNPDSMYAVTSHPALAELFEQPGLEETLRQLGADPRINDVLSSGEPITGEKLAALMESPAILRLFDNREFVQTLKQVLHEVESEALLSANLDW